MANVTLIDVAKGAISGHELAVIVGRRSNIGTPAAPEDIWLGGEAAAPVVNKTFPVAAGSLSVVSSDAADTGAGTGLRSLVVEGLDGNWARISDIVTMNGVTPVNTVKTFLRVNRAYADRVGSGGKNAGEVRVSHGGAGLQACILAELGEALMAHYSVPAGMEAYLLQAWAEASAEGPIVRLFQRPGAASVEAPQRVVHDVKLGDEALQLPMRALPKFIAKTDLWMRALGAAGTTYVSAGFDLLLVTT